MHNNKILMLCERKIPCNLLLVSSAVELLHIYPQVTEYLEQRQTLNQDFHYTRCINPKSVTSLRNPSLRHYACEQPFKKMRLPWRVLVTLCTI